MPGDIASIMAMLQGGPKNINEQSGAYGTFEDWLRNALGMNQQQVPFAMRGQLMQMYQQGNSNLSWRDRMAMQAQLGNAQRQQESDWQRAQASEQWYAQQAQQQAYRERMLEESRQRASDLESRMTATNRPKKNGGW